MQHNQRTLIANNTLDLIIAFNRIQSQSNNVHPQAISFMTKVLIKSSFVTIISKLSR